MTHCALPSTPWAARTGFHHMPLYAANVGGVFQRLGIIAGWAWIAVLAVQVIRDRKVAGETEVTRR
ncbi:MAG TPA: hypothetical protein VK595_11870 [Vicinamibacterales bacterium]|nr:hypothetical protein [Vicinamibacterales bacterium]